MHFPRHKSEESSTDFVVGFVIASARLHAVLFAFFGFVLLISSSSIPAAAWLPIGLFLLMVFAASTLAAFGRYKRHKKRFGLPHGWGLLNQRARGEAAAHIALGFLGE